MRRIFVILMLLVLSISLISCGSSKEKLYILNWDEYIDEGLLDKFEEEYDCKVIMEIAESNEIMFSRIDTNSADYDIAFPSDYMISQLATNNMLKEIEFDKLENYSEDMLVPELLDLINKDCLDIKPYLVPYFWGSLGIMYNTDLIEDFDERIAALEEEGKNAWNILFDKELEEQIGMYATSRDSIACALMALGYSVNTKEEADLLEAEVLLKNMNYKAWATDDLKVGVAGGKYGMALVYSGDYIDALYSIDDATEANFSMYCPKDINNVFFDAMVIPKTSKNTELAYKFIDFMINTEVSDEELEEDEEAVSNAFANADAVGYCPTIKVILDEFLDTVEEEIEALEEDPEAEVSYVGIVDQDAYNPSDIEGGEVYQYLGEETYKLYEDIYKRVKSNTDEDDTNTSGYILIGIVGLIVLAVGSKILYDKVKAKRKEQE